ncbi:MAG: RES family NAD+ phosphorylase [Pseudomonadota bacterium]
MQFKGHLYRALNPHYAAAPLSGAGAARYGGRFNAKGTPALYTALSPETALREANQVGTLQPTTLVALRARIDRLFDARDGTALARYQMTPDLLASPTWRNDMRITGIAPTQAFAKTLVSAGYDAMLVPSYAAGAAPTSLNIVLWSWADSATVALSVVDDENRLS